MARKRKKGRRPVSSRLVEALGAAALFLIVLVFTASILDRYRQGDRNVTRVSWPPEPRGREVGPDEAPVEIARAETPSLDGGDERPVAERVFIEVQNGTGAPGLAREVTLWLRRAGFDVVDFGNAARSDHPTTLVLDRSSRGDVAERLATVLRDGLGVGELRPEPVEEPDVDICVVLGADVAQAWAAREARTPPPGESPAERAASGR